MLTPRLGTVEDKEGYLRLALDARGDVEPQADHAGVGVVRHDGEERIATVRRRCMNSTVARDTEDTAP